MASSETPPPTHILYHFYFSICSIYARYAYAMRGQLKEGAPEYRVEEKHVDLRPPHFEQMTEWFLCEMSARGEVPILVTTQDGTILPDSRKIMWEMAESYPSLLPAEHQQEIERISAEIHKVEYYSLTFWGKYQVPTQTIAMLLERMNQDGISERYYNALAYKIDCTVKREIPGLQKQSRIDAIAQTKKVFAEVEPLLQTTKTQWLQSTAHATALDVQVIVFVSRLQDMKQDDLIPESVAKYAAKAFAQPEWKNMMQDRQTIPPGGF